MKEKPSRKNRSFTEEFKLEAIELSKKIGNSKAARELGISESGIRGWKKKFEQPLCDQISKSSKKSYSDLEKENRRLQKELGYLKEINKVLKKSTAIFSSDQMENMK